MKKMRPWMWGLLALGALWIFVKMRAAPTAPAVASGETLSGSFMKRAGFV